MAIQYVVGDTTNPVGPGHKIIVHVCNNVGGWGAGFVLALSRKWSGPEQAYRRQARSGLELGTIQIVKVESDVTVVNMIAQVGYGNSNSRHKADVDDYDDSRPPIRYEALETCLSRVAAACIGGKMSVHMPRIGCDLAGGRWSEVEPIIHRTMVTAGVDVVVYDLPGGRFNP